MASAEVPKMMAIRESSAKAPVIVFTVSQPSLDSRATSVGPALPLTPKMARDRVSVGAPPLLPAMEMMPTRAKDPKAPMIVASTACQRLRPWAIRVAPRGIPRIEILAANQTQKSCPGDPFLWSSGTGSMPLCSTLERMVPSLGAVDMDCLLRLKMYWM